MFSVSNAKSIKLKNRKYFAVGVYGGGVNSLKYEKEVQLSSKLNLRIQNVVHKFNIDNKAYPVFNHLFIYL